MGLRDGQIEVLVQRYERVRGDLNQSKLAKVGAPIPVRVNPHPLDSETRLGFGVASSADFELLVCHGVWPGDLHSRVVYPDGSEWDTARPPRRSRLGRGTRATRVLVERRPDAK